MTPSQKRWEIAPEVPQTVTRSLSDLPTLMAQLLYNRGIAEPDQAADFLGDTELHDPSSLPDIGSAVSRIRRAIRSGEAIAVYGDYDADGVTATCLLIQTLDSYGARVEPYIPHRADEGYGLNCDAIRELASRGVRLMITVDCGVRSIAEAQFARECGIDLIITDHHSAGPELPPCVACVDPKRPESVYPFRELSGVGVAFKLAEALLKSHRDDPIVAGREPVQADDLLDLVALGTVADLAPLLGENRTLVKLGLARINDTRRPGLRALMELGGLHPGAVNAGQISYVLAPRLNAAGRLDTAMDSFAVLMATDPVQTQRLAQAIDAQNRERQRLTADAVDRVRKGILAGEPLARLLFIQDREVPGGIAGLVASRLLDEFHRPAIVIHLADAESRGSARSIPDFNITEALDECADLLIRHGGHAAAAGFEATNENLDALGRRLIELAHRRLTDEDLVPSLSIDCEVAPEALDWDTMKWIESMEPFGYANRAPLFVSRRLAVLDHRLVGESRPGAKRHMKMRVAHGGKVFDAIAFRQGDWDSCLTPTVDLAYSLESNTWNGRTQLQLNVRDIHPSGQR